jgi:hypothetical protein
VRFEFFLNSSTLEEEGGCRLIFFSPPSFDMWKEEGKGVYFFLTTLFSFIVEWLGRVVRVFFSFDMLKGDGRGRGLNSFYKFIIGVGGV